MISKCCQSKVHKQNGSLFCTNCIRIISKNETKCENKYVYVILVILISLLLIAKADAPMKERVFNNHYSISEIKNSIFDVALNDSAILSELVKNGCVLPSVAVAQAKIESAHYTSKKTFTNLNIFGIKFHKCKYVKGINNYQAVYSSYRDCIADYCEIQNLYLKNIDGHYATNNNYVSLIKKVK